MVDLPLTEEQQFQLDMAFEQVEDQHVKWAHATQNIAAPGGRRYYVTHIPPPKPRPENRRPSDVVHELDFN